MNKADLIQAVAKESGLQGKDVHKALASFQRIILEVLKKESEVQVLDLGKMKVVERKERVGVNPRDPSKKVTIPARKIPQLRPSRKFKDFVDGGAGIDQFSY